MSINSFIATAAPTTQTCLLSTYSLACSRRSSAHGERGDQRRSLPAATELHTRGSREVSSLASHVGLKEVTHFLSQCCVAAEERRRRR